MEEKLLAMLTTLPFYRADDKNAIDETEHTRGITDSMWNPRAWRKYLNPAEWFKGMS